MSHPLDGAHFRVEWAGRRLDELKSSVEAYAEQEREANDVEGEFFPSGRVELRLSAMSAPPQEVAALLSECIGHLRSALDYLVYELAIRDSGQVQNGTQFPVESRPEDFLRRRKTFLVGLREEHVEAIRLLQPCNGCEWTKTLVSISNPDKHRSLIGTHGSQEMRASIGIGFPDDLKDLPGNLKPLINDPVGRYVKVNHDVAAVSVTFGDGEPGVVETVERLKSQVTETVGSFNPCFEGNCPHQAPTPLPASGEDEPFVPTSEG